jgi:hypothetical protein
MHGLIEAVAFCAFFGTAIAAFVLRLAGASRPRPTMLLIGCWPLIAGLISEGRAFGAAPGLWLAGTAITFPAMWVGSMAAAALLRRRAQRTPMSQASAPDLPALPIAEVRSRCDTSNVQCEEDRV